MKNLNLNRLFYFHTFVRKNNVVGAAKELLISQPALSVQLKQLEEELDVTLFDRSTRNLELTEKGKHLYHYTKKIFNTCETLIQDIKATPGEASTLRIGVSNQIERPFSVQYVGSLYRDNLPVDAKRFYVTSGAHEELVKQITDNNLDILLSNEVTENDSVTALAKFDVPVVLAVPRSYKGARTPAISKDCLKALATQDISLVLPTANFSLRKKTEEFLLENGITPTVVFESDILAVLIRAIADGIGAGFVPLAYLKHERREEKIKIAGLPNGYWKETLWLLANRNFYKKTAQTAMASSLVSAFVDICN